MLEHTEERPRNDTFRRGAAALGLLLFSAAYGAYVYRLIVNPYPNDD